MLNDFRRIDITWDRANKRIYEPIQVSSSDEDGRKLVVQVLNGNQVEDLTGASLNLYWETKSKHYRGLDLFDVIDAKKGLFELYFTTGMLSNIGQLNAHLHLIDGTGAVTSESFKIHVFEGIDAEAIESEDSFSTLIGALNRVVEIETQEHERKDNEKARKRAEDLRQKQENTRQTQEEARERGEVDRNTKYKIAETSRDRKYDTREDERDSLYSQAETGRSNKYKTAEDNRDSLYESAEDRRDAEFAPLINDHIDKDISTEEVHGITLADYVIEQGENYAKWNSGKLECWGKVNVSTGSGGFFALNLPQFFIDDKAYVNCGPLGYTYRDLVVNSYVIGGGVRIEGYAYSVGGSPKPNIEVAIQFYAIGRWK